MKSSHDMKGKAPMTMALHLRGMSVKIKKWTNITMARLSIETNTFATNKSPTSLRACPSRLVSPVTPQSWSASFNGSFSMNAKSGIPLKSGIGMRKLNKFKDCITDKMSSSTG